MDSTVQEADAQNFQLDILGQQPFLNKLYTQITACFVTSDADPGVDIAKTLTLGLDRLAASFPWIAGRVVLDDRRNGCTCNASIAPWKRAPILVMKDLRSDPSIPAMAELRDARFPMRWLDESVLSPCKTLSGAATDMPAYVFAVQATLVRGGLLLTFVAQHNTMDMIGQGEVIRLLSKACAGEEFTSQEIASGHAARHDIVPLLDPPYEPGPELDDQIIRPQTSGAAPEPPTCTWAYFGFSNGSLADLKAQASRNVATPPGYVSTDDVLSALIWQHVTRVRLARVDPTASSTFARAVDVRRYLKVDLSYPGLLQNMTYNTLPATEAAERPLGVLASYLRRALDPDPSQLAYRTRALATAFHRNPDKSAFSLTAAVNPSTGISLSSWAKVGLYDLDFNLGLGKPEAVRRPRFDPVESLGYIMPKRPDGELVVGICLREEDMEGLKADAEFAKYGVYIG